MFLSQTTSSGCRTRRRTHRVFKSHDDILDPCCFASASTWRGKSCQSDQETGPIGHDQRGLESERRNRRLNSRGLGLADGAGASVVTLDPHLSGPMPTARPCRFGRSNAAAEWAARGIAVGRNNWTFAGSDAEGYWAAADSMPSETCELNDADAPAWLAPVRAKPRDRPAKRRDEWPPWNWTPRQQAIAEAA